jgi:hypothetical protein
MRVTTLWLLVAFIPCILPVETPAREDAPARRGSWSFDLLDDAERTLPTFSHGGRTYVLGTAGRRYRVRVRNDSGRRAEVVVSVDGRDVVDGGPSSVEKRGYLVEAHGEVIIDGYRLSENAVAAFRFGTVARSYASLEGDARDVGVIGVAVFPERPPRPAPMADSLSREGKLDAEGSPGAPGSASAKSAPRSEEALGAGPPERRPGLGTSFGEEHDSRVRRVAFERAGSRPEVVLSLRYDDRAGLLAAGIDLDGRRRDANDARQRRTADPFRRDASFAPPPPGWTPSG